MKQMLAPLRAVNSSSKAEKSRTREDRGANEAPRVLEAEHPVVRTHPETGRKARRPHPALRRHDRGGERAIARVSLRASGATRVHLPLPLGARLDHALDNRCALHNPINDYHGFRRIMHRVTLAGDRPR
jgi:taurine dioxygenase